MADTTDRLARIAELARTPLVTEPGAAGRTVAHARERAVARPARFTRPRFSLAHAAILALFALGAGFGLGQLDRGPARNGTAAAETPMTFLLVARNAREVSLVGDFNSWEPGQTLLERRPDGVWSVIVALPPGRYAYAFLIDGSEWVRDPVAPVAADEDFGRPSSVLIVEQRTL